MKTCIQILSGVKKIGWIDCANLFRRVDLMAICGMPMPILTTIHPIMFLNEPECECRRQKKEGNYQDEAILTFLAARELPYGIQLGFIVTDVNGQSFLIGSREPPFPIVALTRSNVTSFGKSVGLHYEVKHVALRSLIPCNIST